LLAFCIALPAAEDQLRRHLPQQEPFGDSGTPSREAAASSGRTPFPVPWMIVMEMPSGFTPNVRTIGFRSISEVRSSRVRTRGCRSVARKAARRSSALAGVTSPGRGHGGTGRRDQSEAMSKSESRGEPGGTPEAKVTRIPAGRWGASFYRHVRRRDREGELGLEKLDVALRSHGEGGERESFGEGLNPWLYASGRPARRKTRPHSDWISRPLRYFAGPSLA